MSWMRGPFGILVPTIEWGVGNIDFTEFAVNTTFPIIPGDPDYTFATYGGASWEPDVYFGCTFSGINTSGVGSPSVGLPFSGFTSAIRTDGAHSPAVMLTSSEAGSFQGPVAFAWAPVSSTIVGVEFQIGALNAVGSLTMKAYDINGTLLESRATSVGSGFEVVQFLYPTIRGVQIYGTDVSGWGIQHIKFAR